MNKELERFADALQPDGDEGTDYVLAGDYVWITVNNISLRITKRGDGVLVEAYDLGKEDGDPVNWTFIPAAFDEPLDPPGYAARVRELEAEGLTTSDAQAAADAEMRGAS